ncbi:MAG TPA: DUF5107 domain-containing protein [Nocardioides sp.]|uniref:DUF5107 domain-containing protein n=1 Tax=Nocardioides sp. TaxID=35761 RepID=UPI002F3F1554
MASTSAATVRRTTVTVRAASLGPASPLPRFTRLRRLPYPDLDPGAPADMRERIAYGRLESPLPYRIQEDYDRSLREVELPACVLENGRLRATVLPTLGGRVWSLYDVVRGRELLFRNPVLQFANFGLTNAWFAGGIEWNLGSTGHTTLSCRPMHVAVVAGPDGDLLRLWEWERTRDLVLQVDLSLPPGSDRLYASTRVVNPDPEEKPLYYWTNIAVSESPGTRVLTTADAAWRTEYNGALRRVPVPHPDHPDVDISYPMASGFPADYFYDLQGQGGLHIVAVEPDGSGFAQTSTRGLRGRKLFLWGSGPAGSRWQEWLCGPGARYAEIQAGWCPTQLEHDRLAGGARVSWTEAFGGVDLDPGAVAGGYDHACAAAQAAVTEVTDPDHLEAVHERWLGEVADAAVAEQVSTGSGWGQVELRLRNFPDAVPTQALPFPPVDDDSLPARHLLDGDAQGLAISASRLPVPPVSDRWRAVLEEAPDSAWVHLARAVNAHVRGERARAAEQYDASLREDENPWALRGLALLADDDRACDLYARARQLRQDCRGLVVEHLERLLAAGRPGACVDVIAALDPAMRAHGRTRLLEARALLEEGDREHAGRILDSLVVEDLAEGDTVLGEVWDALHPGEPLPGHLDFRMSDAGER